MSIPLRPCFYSAISDKRDRVRKTADYSEHLKYRVRRADHNEERLALGLGCFQRCSCGTGLLITVNVSLRLVRLVTQISMRCLQETLAGAQNGWLITVNVLLITVNVCSVIGAERPRTDRVVDCSQCRDESVSGGLTDRYPSPDQVMQRSEGGCCN